MAIVDDAVLNGIASGLRTRMDISTKLNINYYTIAKTIVRLRDHHHVCEHHADNGEIYYTLSKEQRFRLYSFDYMPFVVETTTSALHTMDDLADPTYVFDDLQIHNVHSQLFGGEIAYVRSDQPIEHVLSVVDHHSQLSSFLPVMCLHPKQRLTVEMVERIMAYHHYKFPIYYAETIGDITEVYVPDVQQLNDFENPTAERVRRLFEPTKEYTIEELAEKIGCHRETVSKILAVLVKQNKIAKKKGLQFANSLYFLPPEPPT